MFNFMLRPWQSLPRMCAHNFLEYFFRISTGHWWILQRTTLCATSTMLPEGDLGEIEAIKM